MSGKSQSVSHKLQSVSHNLQSGSRKLQSGSHVSHKSHNSSFVSHNTHSDSYVSEMPSKCSSVKSSILSAKLQEHQKQAELAARVKALKFRQVLEQSKLKIEQEEELAINTEIAVSAARSKVLDCYDGINDLESQMTNNNKPGNK